MTYTLGGSTVYSDGLANSFYTKLPVSYVTEIKGSGPSTSIGDFVVLYDALTKSITVENTSSGYTFTDKSVKVSLVKNADFVGSVSQVSLDTDPAPNRVFSFESVDTADVSKINGYMIQISNVGLAFTGTPLTDGAWVCTGGRGFEFTYVISGGNVISLQFTKYPNIPNDPSLGILDLTPTASSLGGNSFLFVVTGTDYIQSENVKTIAMVIGRRNLMDGSGVSYLATVFPNLTPDGTRYGINGNSSSEATITAVLFLLRIEKVINGDVGSQYRGLEFYHLKSESTATETLGFPLIDAQLLPNARYGGSCQRASVVVTALSTCTTRAYERVINSGPIGWVDMTITFNGLSPSVVVVDSFVGCDSVSTVVGAGSTRGVITINIINPNEAMWLTNSRKEFMPTLAFIDQFDWLRSLCGLTPETDWSYNPVNKILAIKCYIGALSTVAAPQKLFLAATKFFG